FLDFQGIGKSGFSTEEKFVQEFCRLVWNRRRIDSGLTDVFLEIMHDWKDRKEPDIRLGALFDALSDWCEKADKGIVVFIDEVDSATNNQVFLDFLAQLRDKYISRDKDGIITFQSVILAGVTDVKHLKSKIRDESEHKVNSPWNIAADFDIDMSLSESGIKGMLDEYEADHQTGMNTGEISRLIHKYTNGYPYLVSRICQKIDQNFVPKKFDNLSKAWTEYGVDEAVKHILSESGNSLFDSLTGKLTNYPDLKEKLRLVLMRGETIAWLPYDEEQQQLYMYGFIRNNHNTVAVSNQIFEMLLYTHFIGESDKYNELKQKASEYKTTFVDADGWLDIPKIMDHFIKEHNRIHKDNSEKFVEAEGRERFITYVSGIINGTGTYSVEEQTRDHKRMDLVIHYLGRRYIIELKIWHGDRYNEKGEEQISGYLDSYGLSTGYMLSFNFNKKKEEGVRRVQIGDKVLFEGTV
ncbi:MAG: AAA-like domain-containing protein, partial [Lachnospiraceae bacterium]|nr:AAA-like domain-containing protein [Lachnospiraceae bacterium]